MLEPSFCYNTPLPFLCGVIWWVAVIIGVGFIIKLFLPKKTIL